MNRRPTARPFRIVSLGAAAALLAAGAATAAPASGTVTVPGGSLHYEVAGEGPAIVLLHDGLLPSATWDAQMPAFTAAYRVVRYDRRGYGESAAPAGSYSDTDDLAAVLAALEISRAVIVGCSSGGELAIDFALAHPEKVDALILVGPVVGGMPYSQHFSRRGSANYAPIFRGSDTAKAIDNWLADPWLTDAGAGAAKARLKELLTRYPAALTGIPPGREPERPAIGRLAEVKAPTLIVVGASDIPDVHAHSGAIEAGIGGARRFVVAGAGHLVHLEKPAEFNALVLRFLRPQDAAAAYLAAHRDEAVRTATLPLLACDRGAPLDVRVAGREQRGPVEVADLSYESPRGGRVPAYLVVPPGHGPFAGAVFVHPGQGDRTTFLDEAVALAPRGLVSLLIDAPERRPEARQGARRPWNGERDRAQRIQGIVDARRGLDLLIARPDIDPARLAFVGHSLGASRGGVLAGVETRVRAWVLMAGFAAESRWWTDEEGRYSAAFHALLTGEQQGEYLDAIAPFDALHYLPHAAPAAVLFQFARRDEYITRTDAELSALAASEPKRVEWYDTDHFFNDDARAYRDAWLAERLALAAPQATP